MIKFNILVFKIYFIIWPPRKNCASFAAVQGYKNYYKMG